MSWSYPLAERWLGLWVDGRVRIALLVLGALLLAALSGQLISLDQAGATSRGDLTWWLVSTRNVVWVVTSVLAISLVLGTLAGALVAYGPRWFSGLLGRLVELSGALPSLIIVGLWRIGDPAPSVASFIAILSVLKTIETARLISAETQRLSSQGFVVAAYALGASRRRVFVVHVFPHLLSALAVASALTAASVVGLEAALSFVGLGLPGSGSWGALLGEAARARTTLTGGVPALRIVLALASVVVATLAFYTLSRAIAKRV